MSRPKWGATFTLRHIVKNCDMLHAIFYNLKFVSEVSQKVNPPSKSSFSDERARKAEKFKNIACSLSQSVII